MERQNYIYIMANKSNKVLYVGVTNNLVRRVWEHKESLDHSSFTSKYNVHKLVYYECFEDITEAIAREKQIKGGSRKKKEALIQSINPSSADLYPTII